jgi:caspase domain-containing protein
MEEEKVNEDYQAIIIGIDKYKDDRIPKLHGAENDAQELQEFLVTGDIKYKIKPEHYLLGDNATCSAIQKAISDVFRKSTQSKLVLFYFSGHGLLYNPSESNVSNEGYLAPYDISPDDPFVGGIKFEDLSNIIQNSQNSASVGLILDCCYAGVITKDTKAAGSSLKNLYVQEIDRFSKKSKGGIYSIASSGPDVTSREKNNCKDSSNNELHTHGAFTYHLLEGLRGEAADKNTGFISFHNLKQYINSKLIEEEKQIPYYKEVLSGDLDNLPISVADSVRKNNIMKQISIIEAELKKSSDSKIPSIRRLKIAATNLKQLIDLFPNTIEADTLIKEINNQADILKTKLTLWLAVHRALLSQPIDDKTTQQNFYQEVLYRPIFRLSNYLSLLSLDKNTLNYIDILTDELLNGRNYQELNENANTLVSMIVSQREASLLEGSI